MLWIRFFRFCLKFTLSFSFSTVIELVLFVYCIFYRILLQFYFFSHYGAILGYDRLVDYWVAGDGYQLVEGIVSVHPIAVADAAPVYSRIILYEVNSLYTVTLYCCDPSLCCTCTERTAYRGDIFESASAYIYIYIYIYTSCMFYFIRTTR